MEYFLARFGFHALAVVVAVVTLALAGLLYLVPHAVFVIGFVAFSYLGALLIRTFMPPRRSMGRTDHE